MKVFIGSLVAFVALIFANCEPLSWKDKTTAKYNNLTETEIKAHIRTALNTIETSMKVAADKDVKEDLQYVAIAYEKIIAFAEEGVANAYKLLDAVNATERHTLLVGLGVSVEGYLLKALQQEKVRGNYTVKVTDTEENLLKKFSETRNQILGLLQYAMDNERKHPEAWFWVEVHQALYDFMSVGFKDLEKDLKTLKTSEIRAKNLQIILNDIAVMLEDPTEQDPGSFFAKVDQKFNEFVAKIKSFFG